MIGETFTASWPDYFDVNVDIAWTPPAPHDLLFSNGIPENDYAYFYAIVARVDREWWPYYIGMTYKQTAAVRHRQADHVQQRSLGGEQRLHCQPRSDVTSLVKAHVAPADLVVLGLRKALTQGGDLGVDARSREHQPGMPAIADDVDANLLLARGIRRPASRLNKERHTDHEPWHPGPEPSMSAAFRPAGGMAHGGQRLFAARNWASIRS